AVNPASRPDYPPRQRGGTLPRREPCDRHRKAPEWPAERIPGPAAQHRTDDAGRRELAKLAQKILYRPAPCHAFDGLLLRLREHPHSSRVLGKRAALRPQGVLATGTGDIPGR